MGVSADAVPKGARKRAGRRGAEGRGHRSLREPLLFEAQQAKVTEAGTALLERRTPCARWASGPSAWKATPTTRQIKWGIIRRFTSHWDLSAARATAVARYLHEHLGSTRGS